jgi:hypothetical protein
LCLGVFSLIIDDTDLLNKLVNNFLLIEDLGVSSIGLFGQLALRFALKILDLGVGLNFALNLLELILEGLCLRSSGAA